MSFEWPSAEAVSLSFHVSGAAAAKTPSLPQFAPLARSWLMRASRLAWESGRLQVETAVVVPPVAALAGVLAAEPAAAGAASPPPHEVSQAHATATARNVGGRARHLVVVMRIGAA